MFDVKRHTVCIVTGTRAEWGLLRGVYHKMCESPCLRVSVVATGAHLLSEFGDTVQEVRADNVLLDAEIEILQAGTAGRQAIVCNTATAVQRFGEYFASAKPDAVLVLGDRYEMFAVGTAAVLLCIPLIHISGGDVTHGAVDDCLRHCLTKMASLHFPACQEYAQRVIRMGEQPHCVENVGGLGDENLRSLSLLSRQELQCQLGFDLSWPYLLVTYHPETAEKKDVLVQLEALLKALAERTEHIIFTKANADAGGGFINARIEEFCATMPQQRIVFASMGALRYLSAMKECAAVVGNSSSGVVEAPTLGVPVVNIGRRQEGRVICSNVICCDDSFQSIREALSQALTPEFREQARKAVSPYYGGNTAQRIVKRIERFFQEGDYARPKIFYDANAEGAVPWSR